MKIVKATLSHVQCAIDAIPCPLAGQTETISVPVRDNYFLAPEYRCAHTMRPLGVRFFLDEEEYFETEH